MTGIKWENCAKSITIETAEKFYEAGMGIEVNDGKDLTVIIEKEPIAAKQNRF